MTHDHPRSRWSFVQWTLCTFVRVDWALLHTKINIPQLSLSDCCYFNTPSVIGACRIRLQESYGFRKPFRFLQVWIDSMLFIPSGTPQKPQDRVAINYAAAHTERLFAPPAQTRNIWYKQAKNQPYWPHTENEMTSSRTAVSGPLRRSKHHTSWAVFISLSLRTGEAWLGTSVPCRNPRQCWLDYFKLAWIVYCASWATQNWSHRILTPARPELLHCTVYTHAQARPHNALHFD